MKRLAIVTTHPIQYYAPLFSILGKSEIELKVFYTWNEQLTPKYDPGFKQYIKWDIPLLEGYTYEFLINTSSRPGSHSFLGIVNPKAINIIEAFKPDAILVFGWSYWSHLNLIRYFKGKVPVWFRGDSTTLDRTSTLASLAREVILRCVYSFVDKAFYVGSENKKYFQLFGLKEDQLIFCPHAVDNERFSINRSNEAKTLRTKLGVSDHQILILFAGKLEVKKDPLTLLEAFCALNSPDAHLLFIGNGELETCLKSTHEWYKRKGLLGGSRVHFMDFQNQQSMPLMYQSADLFCLPSVGPGETWGLAVNEAMAAGKAILISDKVGCSTDLVKETINGAIFKNGNKESLLLKLQQLMDQKTLKDYGCKSKEIIDNWTLEKAAESIVGELKKLILIRKYE